MIFLSKGAETLWDNWNKYDDLDSVYRQGFLKTKVYGFGNELKSTIDTYRVESTLIHSGRAAMLFSDLIDLWPAYYEGIDKYIALKVALNHDIGELIVGDVCDDGRKEHEDKKASEWAAVVEHYNSLPEDVYLACRYIHQQFEEASSFLGQSIKLTDKLDFLAKLIKLESQGYDLENVKDFTKGDLRLASEINCYSLIDVCANRLRHLFVDHQFDQRLTQIGAQFLTCGLYTINRSFFEWWQLET